MDWYQREVVDGTGGTPYGAAPCGGQQGDRVEPKHRGDRSWTPPSVEQGCDLMRPIAQAYTAWGGGAGQAASDPAMLSLPGLYGDTDNARGVPRNSGDTIRSPGDPPAGASAAHAGAFAAHSVRARRTAGKTDNCRLREQGKTRLLEKRRPWLAGISVGPDSVSPCEGPDLHAEAVGVGLAVGAQIIADGVPGPPTTVRWTPGRPPEPRSLPNWATSHQERCTGRRRNRLAPHASYQAPGTRGPTLEPQVKER